MEAYRSQKGVDEEYVFVSLNRKDSEGNLLPYVKDNKTNV